jgi:EAL domain-containing protein (putative c-di-GMP-specific phosphodiesterase class I)
MKKSVKLVFVAPLVLALAAALCVGAYKALQQYLIDQSEQLVHTMAQGLVPAMLANDHKKVDALLKTLQDHPGIDRAELISGSGIPLASFARDGLVIDPISPQFELASAEGTVNEQGVFVMAPVTFDTQILANLHIAVNLWPIYKRIMMWVGLLIGIPTILYVLIKRSQLKIRFEKKSSYGGSDSNGGGFDLTHALSEALDDADISLEYQPIKRISDSGVFGMDIVVCWRHPSGQTLHVSPADFVMLTKKMGLFFTLDNWVLETACKQASLWQRLHGPLVLALDISFSQLNDPDFYSKVRAACELGQYPHQLLEFQIQERALSNDLAANSLAVDRFIKQGLSLTIDGFGLSVGSAQLLSSLSAQRVKFHPHLIKNVAHDAEMRSWVKSLADVALSREIQLMADGVHAHQQCSEMQKMGCLLGQGAYFDQPMSAQQFSDFLDRQQLAGSFAGVAHASASAGHAYSV